MANTILTGLRANSDLHLGNYLGGIQPIVELQKKLSSEDKFFFFVPDLHSFTTPTDHSKLFDTTLLNIKIYLAAGFDPEPENVFLYRQSSVSAHSELTWILSCFTYMGEMSKMIQFKEKSQKAVDSNESISVGLFTYPILMAADILLYGADYVPVGDDQRQHIEIARDIAIRINNKFASEFPDGVFARVPKSWKDQLVFTGLDQGVRIRSLSNPEVKMSKSVTDPKGTILLTDNPQDAAKKVMSATTDSFGEIKFDWAERPGISNLLTILAMLSGQELEEVKKTWEGGTMYGNLKKEVANVVENFLTEFQTNMNSISDQKVLEVLEKGEVAVNVVANKTLLRVQRAVGIRR
jgi:tryptophanyl-tRNA synthetase